MQQFKWKMDSLWNGVKRTPYGSMVQRELDLPLAYSMWRNVFWLPTLAIALGQQLLARPLLLRGADGSGYGDQSRVWLANDLAGGVMDFSGTGSEGQFNIFDWWTVDTIGFAFSVAGTATATALDFDRYPGPNASGTIISADLDGTNGTVTAPNATTAQAIGAVVWKELADTGPVICNPGNSIDVDVRTACTSGNGLAFVLGYPHPERPLNLAASVFIGT